MKHLVLVGAGHAHLVVLEALARRPLPDARITLLSPIGQQAYSGMLPGWMAGLYSSRECLIDVGALAARAGVEFVAMRLRRLDAVNRRIETDRGTTLGYDLLSINSGAHLNLDAIAGLHSPIFIRTVKLKDLPWNGWLTLATAGAPAAAWNPIAGLTDPFGRLVGFTVGDPALLPSPYEAGWMLNRIADLPASRGQ